MLKRVRQLRIPLAAKCELLFGAAVVLVIAAALFVPWQRMDQLTAQLNEKAAAAVAHQALGEHLLRQSAGERESDPTTRPSNGEITINDRVYSRPKLISVDAIEDPEHLTRFEFNSLSRFRSDPRLLFHARLDATNEIYRFAQPLFAQNSCVACHAPRGLLTEASGAAVNGTSPTAAALPTTQPAAPLIGMITVEIPSQISTRQIVLNRVFLLTAGLLAGTIAIIIFYVVTTRLILQPVRVLQETAEKVSQGDLNIRSDISSGDEFQQLSETLNTMLVNLKNSTDQLRAANKSLDLRLGELAESNVALHESNRLKSEFLASVSHELRTPLNSILGFAELLRDLVAKSTEPKSVRYVQNILTSGNNLLYLINDLLDLAKIEAGRMEVRSQPLSIPDLFEALTTLLKPLTEEKLVTIVATIAPDVPIMHTDRDKLRQVLYNFLSNAIKFSPTGEQIDLSAERDEESVTISVTDRGPGIEADKQGVIFEKFRQLEGGVTRSHSGTGLGLAIARELTTLLGGSIGVRSAPGEGATFWVRLPVSIEARQQDVRQTLVLS